MTNSFGNFIRNCFSPMVNRDSIVFKALLANRQQTGTLEKIFLNFEEARKAWSRTDVYTQPEEQFEKTFSYCSVLQRRNYESQEDFAKRNRLIFRRLGHKKWGSFQELQILFRDYFATDRVWIINNAEEYENSLLKNGDFEQEELCWKMVKCARSNKARFCGTQGALFKGMGSCSQVVPVKQDATYYLHWFSLGKIKVSVQNDKGLYWNPDNGEFGDWQELKHTFRGESEKFHPFSFFVLSRQSEEFTVTFEVDETQTYLDYVRLFKKDATSKFVLIGNFDGYLNQDISKTAHLAPGRNDPIEALKADLYGYFAGDFTYGALEKAKQMTEQKQKEIFSTCVDFIRIFCKTEYDGVLTDALQSAEVKGTEYNSTSLLSSCVDYVKWYLEHILSPFTLEEIIQAPEDADRMLEGEQLELFANNADYMDETVPLAPDMPDGNDASGTVDYDKASYFDDAYIYGAQGTKPQEFIDELLEVLSPGGVSYCTELLTRDLRED